MPPKYQKLTIDDWDRANLFTFYTENVHNKDERFPKGEPRNCSGKKEAYDPHNTVPHPG